MRAVRSVERARGTTARRSASAGRAARARAGSALAPGPTSSSRPSSRRVVPLRLASVVRACVSAGGRLSRLARTSFELIASSSKVASATVTRSEISARRGPSVSVIRWRFVTRPASACSSSAASLTSPAVASIVPAAWSSPRFSRGPCPSSPLPAFSARPLKLFRVSPSKVLKSWSISTGAVVRATSMMPFSGNAGAERGPGSSSTIRVPTPTVDP